jgi:DNA-binding HxlR family transcriptional regulator
MEEIKLQRGDPNEKCPIEAAIEIIGSKWTFLIIRDLLIDGTVRFGDLLRSLDGISPKTLSLRLRELEKYGLVNRIVYPEIPPKVEYKLTDEGKGLESVFIELKKCLKGRLTLLAIIYILKISFFTLKKNYLNTFLPVQNLSIISKIFLAKFLIYLWLVQYKKMHNNKTFYYYFKK